MEAKGRPGKRKQGSKTHTKITVLVTCGNPWEPQRDRVIIAGEPVTRIHHGDVDWNTAKEVGAWARMPR